MTKLVIALLLAFICPAFIANCMIELCTTELNYEVIGPFQGLVETEKASLVKVVFYGLVMFFCSAVLGGVIKTLEIAMNNGEHYVRKSNFGR